MQDKKEKPQGKPEDQAAATAGDPQQQPTPEDESHFEVRRHPSTAGDSFMGRLDIGTVHHFTR